MEIVKIRLSSELGILDPLISRLCGGAGTVSDLVSSLLEEVRRDGDAAVLRLTERFDGVSMGLASRFRVSEAMQTKALENLSDSDARIIRKAKDNIEWFHRQGVPQSWEQRNPDGALVGERFYPIQRVGLYVPGGQVPLVSTVLMTVVPAMVAGCEQIAVCTPPQRDGCVDPGLLAALGVCGVSEIYSIGGVQAIAAMAYGTETIRAVDKVFGPGNAYVNEAKRQLFGTVGVDLLPGPSEVLVLADSSAKPSWVAADLIAQAEHGSGKEKVYLVLADGAKLEPILSELDRQVVERTHRPAIEEVLKNRFVIVEAATAELAVSVANRIAPEHMELLVEPNEAEWYLSRIRTAGALLVGHETPTVLGDFVAGPSHTLPTDTTARFSGGIQVVDFMRRSSLVRYDTESVARAWPVVAGFARMERLDGHGESLRLRVEGGGDSEGSE